MPDPDFSLYSALGEPVSDWRAWGPARKPARWRPGRSAMELARAWFTSPVPVMPPEIRELLDSHDRTRGVALESGHAETVIPLLATGETRQFDLLLRGRAAGGKLLIGVEARADETYGSLLLKKVRQPAAPEAGPEPDPDALALATTLLAVLFRAEADPLAEPWSRIRYRLLTGAAGTALQAARDGASLAAFVVHEFVSPLADPVTEAENLADLETFAALLLPGVAKLHPGQLVGPVRLEHPLLAHPVELVVGRAVAVVGG